MTGRTVAPLGSSRVERWAAPVRRSGMRPYVLLAGVVLMWSVAACDSGPATATGGSAAVAAAPSDGPSAVVPSGEATPAAGRELSAGVPDPTPSGAPARARPSGSPSGGPGGGADPDNPRDLVGAPVVLTGTVSRAGGCVILEVGGRRWALTGQAAARLVDRQRVTVRGRPVAVPAGCDAAFALVLRATAGR